MKIVNKSINEIKPYENNPRFNDDSVEKVANSIKQFGFQQPIVIDKDGVIIAGHTRYKASLELGLEEVPCVIFEGSEEQAKAYRLADNKVGESSAWNYDFLEDELDAILNIDMTDFGFLDMTFEEDDISDETNTLTGEKYTTKISTPIYEITGQEPSITELIKNDKARELLSKIEKANITKEQKEFLIKATYRHLVFDYAKIAEYYAHQDAEMQELMEDSALVIIDFNKAIENGYVQLRSEIEGYEAEEYDEYDE